MTSLVLLSGNRDENILGSWKSLTRKAGNLARQTSKIGRPIAHGVISLANAIPATQGYAKAARAVGTGIDSTTQAFSKKVNSSGITDTVQDLAAMLEKKREAAMLESKNAFSHIPKYVIYGGVGISALAIVFFAMKKR